MLHYFSFMTEVYTEVLTTYHDLLSVSLHVLLSSVTCMPLDYIFTIEAAEIAEILGEVGIQSCLTSLALNSDQRLQYRTHK